APIHIAEGGEADFYCLGDGGDCFSASCENAPMRHTLPWPWAAIGIRRMASANTRISTTPRGALRISMVALERNSNNRLLSRLRTRTPSNAAVSGARTASARPARFGASTTTAPHSIRRSARLTVRGDNVTPITLAVLRFTTKVHRVGY